MAKKAKKDKLTEFEKFMMDIEYEPTMVDIAIGEHKFSVEVKQHVDRATRSAVIAKTEEMYFPLGEYDPNHGDAVLSFILFQLYTGMTFDNNTDAFETFKSTAAYEKIYAHFPGEYDDLERNVMHKAKILCKKYYMPAVEEKMFTACGDLVFALTEAVGKLDLVLGATAADIGENGAVNIKDMFDALQMMGKKDERKIAKAVLEFQEAKKKQAVEEAPKIVGVPRI